MSRFFSFFVAALLICPATAGADASVPGLLATGHVDEAIAALDGQLKKSPDDAAAHNLLCRAYFSLGDWDRGISSCERAVALSPDNSQFHLWLGRIYGEKADKSSFLTAAGLAKYLGQLNGRSSRGRSCTVRPCLIFGIVPNWS